jgi:hypothetical protein
MVQNDPGQQTPIKQSPPQEPDPKSRARTPMATDDVTPPADPAKGRTPMVPPNPFRL